MLSKEQVRKLVNQYATKVVEVLSPTSPVSVVLYGSHAKGNATANSDIDVAVIYDGFGGDWLKTSALLWKLSSPISLDIEPILLDKTKDQSGFIQNIYATGEVVYGV